jgi:hypothetical protein
MQRSDYLLLTVDSFEICPLPFTLQSHFISNAEKDNVDGFVSR